MDIESNNKYSKIEVKFTGIGGSRNVEEFSDVEMKIIGTFMVIGHEFSDKIKYRILNLNNIIEFQIYK